MAVQSGTLRRLERPAARCCFHAEAVARDGPDPSWHWNGPTAPIRRSDEHGATLPADSIGGERAGQPARRSSHRCDECGDQDEDGYEEDVGGEVADWRVVHGWLLWSLVDLSAGRVRVGARLGAWAGFSSP